MNQFPISGTRASSPGDSLEAEDPLLLNPYEAFKADDHFIFGLNGVMAGKTPRGRATIRICNLNREDLRTDRQREWEKNKINLFIALASGGDKKIVSDNMEFSAYLKQTLRNFIRDQEQRI